MTRRLKAGLVVGVALGSIVLMHLRLLDGLDGWLLARLLGEDTTYAAGYSDSAFRAIRVGDDATAVRESLGAPIYEQWRYEASGQTALLLQIKDGKVAWGSEPKAGIRVDDSAARVLELLGRPVSVTYVYTRSGSDQNYRVRSIILNNGKVIRKVNEFYLD